MRKFLLCICLISVVFLSSCIKKSEIIPKTDSFKFTAVTQADNTKFEIYTVVFNNKTEFTINSPEEIRNLKLSFSGEFVNFYYLNLEHKLHISSLPFDFPARIIHEGLSAAKKNPTVFKENNQYYIKFSVEGKKYLLYYTQTGLPIKIESQNGESKIELYGVSLLN